jgi:3-phosphoshikimate 1-carboxyvinyltransferase
VEEILTSKKTSGLNGEITVPGDKSISHRALMLNASAIGEAKVYGLLESEDVLNTAKALNALGAKITNEGDVWGVKGVGVGGFQEPKNILDLGNSGTAVRLLMGLVSTCKIKASFTGDSSLRKRPMMRVLSPLSQMGVKFSTREGGLLPVNLDGTNSPLPISYTLPVASAQVKSAILFAALNTPGITTIVEKEETRDHSELMLKYLGADIEIKKSSEGKQISIKGFPKLVAKDVRVPADPSSAAFLVVAAIITNNSHLVIKNVLINPFRIGLFTTLQEMGANIKFLNERVEAGEKIADIEVKSSRLRGVEVPAERAPSMIDEYPILSIAASVAEGVTKMEGLKELRVKESDRLKAIYDGLVAVGVNAKMNDDSLHVQGGSINGGVSIETHMDHRIAMSFLVAGMVSENPISVNYPEMINTSFPGFVRLVNKIGGKINS